MLARIIHFSTKLLLCMPLMACMMNATAAQEAKVFPVRAFFFDNRPESKLDVAFKSMLEPEVVIKLGDRIHANIGKSFKGRAGKLNTSNANSTFAVSFHIVRANSFSVEKGNGNSDVVATLTGSVYFTNIISGEILTTISKSVVSRSIVPTQPDLTSQKRLLYGQALDSLITDLLSDAGRQFNPINVETKLSDRFGELLIFDAGYSKGIQVGDQINGTDGNLINILYSSEKYSVGKSLFPGNINLGASFSKFMSHPATGKDRPRVAVLIESLPVGYSKDYIARLFSDLLGDSAPISIVQVNTGFSQLLNAVKQDNDAQLSNMNSADRLAPNLIIRLNVSDPIHYQVDTNLAYEKTRRYETRVFADVIDSSGRINFSVSGADVINDKITHGIGVGVDERREVNIKNALADVAKKFVKLTNQIRDQSEIVNVTGSDYQINSPNKIFSKQQVGFVLRKARAKIGNDTQSIYVPIVEASVTEFNGKSPTTLTYHMQIESPNAKVVPGDIFEVTRFGTPPQSATTFAACGPVETLGNAKTPLIMQLMTYSLGQKMPGMFYVQNAAELSKDIIGTQTGFSSGIKWDIPNVSICIQPVDRVTIGDEQCGQHCERSITSRTTLRIKSGENILNRIGFESQYKSTGYYKSSDSTQLKKQLDADILDEAGSLLDKAVEKISLK